MQGDPLVENELAGETTAPGLPSTRETHTSADESDPSDASTIRSRTLLAQVPDVNACVRGTTAA